GKNRRNVIALIKRVHRVFIFLTVHDADAYDAGDEIDRLHDEREENALDSKNRVKRCAEDHGADVFCSGGFEDVRATASAVAYVVTDEIGDDGRIAWIVFGDSGFYFADEVCADVSCLGVDAAAELGKERHQRCAEAKADELERSFFRVG